MTSASSFIDCMLYPTTEAVKKPTSRSAKKNAKRKEKKASEADGNVDAAAEAVSSMR